MNDAREVAIRLNQAHKIVVKFLDANPLRASVAISDVELAAKTLAHAYLVGKVFDDLGSM